MSTPAVSIRQPPVESLRNALQITSAWMQDASCSSEAHGAFTTVTMLLLKVLDQFGEPSLEAVQATATLLRECPLNPQPRYCRDVAAGILAAQLKGITPATWGPE